MGAVPSVTIVPAIDAPRVSTIVTPVTSLSPTTRGSEPISISPAPRAAETRPRPSATILPIAERAFSTYEPGATLVIVNVPSG